MVLSAKEASLAHTYEVASDSCPYRMHWNRVLYRYLITLSAASWCILPGRQLCLESLAAAKAMSGLVEIAAYRIDPIFLWYNVLSASITSSSICKGSSSSSAIGVHCHCPCASYCSLPAFYHSWHDAACLRV